MSELLDDLEGLHKHVKRFSEKNDENLFEELKSYIEEEKVRRKLALECPGELFFSIKMTILSKIPFTAEEFTGSPSLLRQLNEDQIETVGQLQSELGILAWYEKVGIETVEKLFGQLKGKQEAMA